MAKKKRRGFISKTISVCRRKGMPHKQAIAVAFAKAGKARKRKKK